LKLGWCGHQEVPRQLRLKPAGHAAEVESVSFNARIGEKEGLNESNHCL
jgi:hypothetical protein